jgi:hypothetical protein
MHDRITKADSVAAGDPGLSVLVMLLRPSKLDRGVVDQMQANKQTSHLQNLGRATVFRARFKDGSEKQVSGAK